MSEIYKEVYGHILSNAQKIRQEVMNEWGDILMFGGSMPDNIMEELSTAARITGLAFDAMEKHGVEIHPVGEKTDLYFMMIDGEKYICHKSAIPSMVGFLDTVKVTDVVKGNVKRAETMVVKEPEPIVPEKPIVQEEPKPVKKPWDEDMDFGFENAKEESIPEPEQEFPMEPEETNESSFFSQEEENYQHVEPERKNIEEVSFREAYKEPETTSDFVERQEVFETEPESFEPEPEPEPEIEDNFETVAYEPKQEPAQEPSISMLTKGSLFIDEKRKHKKEFVYSMIDVSLTHSGSVGGGKPVEMQIMIAPLKIYGFSNPNVPIVVSIYCNGKISTASSFDQKEEGKNMVMIDFEEFYLMCRGTFDAQGKFHAYVTTTGISANQGDVLTVNAQDNYGEDAGSNVNNGHIKFRTPLYDEDEGTIEVIPFGDPENNEFVVITKGEEFIDYIFVGTDGGLKKAVVYVGDQKKQIACNWDKEYLNVELVEA